MTKRLNCVAIESMESRRLLSTTYYVSPSGNDDNSGTSAGSPWATVAKVNAATFQPGDSILFQYGAQFHEALNATSSGTAASPITYGAYGDATQGNPEFVGSDPLDTSSFSLVTGTTYAIPSTAVIDWAYDNHAFMHESTDALNVASTPSTDPGTNITYVENNSETFYYDSTTSMLYVNVGGSLTGHVITATTRDEEINSIEQSNLVFTDLSVTECAADNTTYAFNVQGGQDVVIDSCVASLTGKHAIGALDTTGFVGENLLADQTAPDLGFGGASAFVAFGDTATSGDTSQWINDTYTNPNGPYGIFITHGSTGAIASILLKNMVSENTDDSGIDCQSTGPDEKIVVSGGQVNGNVTIGTDNSTIDGLAVNGPLGTVNIEGANDVVQNCVFTNLSPDVAAGQNGGVVINGSAATNDTIRFNTFDFTGGPAVDVKNVTSNADIYANIFDCDQAILLYFTGTGEQTSNYNIFGPSASNGTTTGLEASTISIQQWQAMGYDTASVIAVPQFADAAASNFQLTASSPAIDLYTATPDSSVIAVTDDFAGNPRPYGGGYDAGAYEFQSPKTVITGSFSIANTDVPAPVAGTSTTAVFTVTLSKAQSQTESVQYATSDGTAVAGTDYSAATGTLTFAPGVTSQNINVTINPNLAPDSSDTFQMTLSSPSTGISLAATAATATVSNVGETTDTFTRKSPFAYTDTAGHRVTLEVGGVGTGTALFESGNADPLQVLLTGTTAGSSFNLLSLHGATTLANANVQSPIGTFNAAANLVGTLTFISSVAHISVDNASDANIDLQSPVGRPSIRLATVDTLNLASAAVIASLNAASWTGTGTIAAGTINVFSVKGEFGANLALSGGLSDAHVGLVSGGTWTIGGETGTVAVTSTDPSWTGTFTGGISSLLVSGNLGGSLTASTIRTMQVRGGLSSAAVSLTGTGKLPDLGALKVGGLIEDSTIRSTGSIGSITAGAAINSTVFAGVSSSLTTLPTVATDFTSAASIASFTVTALRSLPTGFSNALIAAASIGKVQVRGVQTANGGIAFGLASESLASFSDIEAGAKPFTWNSKLAASLLNFAGDFKVALI